MLAVQIAREVASGEAVMRTSRGGRPLSEPAIRTLSVRTKHGLHLRPCSAIVTAVGQYQARVTVQKGSESVNADSMLGLLSLAACAGTELLLSASGAEAQEALEAVAELFASDFLEC